jgi:DNA invertase Pin-like site-specific DNA recombinase
MKQKRKMSKAQRALIGARMKALWAQRRVQGHTGRLEKATPPAVAKAAKHLKKESKLWRSWLLKGVEVRAAELEEELKQLRLVAASLDEKE